MKAHRVYLASPLGFSPENRDYLYRVKRHLFSLPDVTVMDPWDEDFSSQFRAMEEVSSVANRLKAAQMLAAHIGKINEQRIRHATDVLGIVDGMEPDSGTVSEMAFGCGLGLRVYGLRTDLRAAGDFFGVALNLQVLRWIEISGGKLFRSISAITLETNPC